MIVLECSNIKDYRGEFSSMVEAIDALRSSIFTPGKFQFYAYAYSLPIAQITVWASRGEPNNLYMYFLDGNEKADGYRWNM